MYKLQMISTSTKSMWLKQVITIYHTYFGIILVLCNRLPIFMYMVKSLVNDHCQLSFKTKTLTLLT